jgi:uncharacterized protein (DUF1015 family)
MPNAASIFLHSHLLQSIANPNHFISMADIFPFRALRYNPQSVPPSRAVTQPYDKISPAMQEGYYAASPYNLVRIILGRREPGDNTEHNVYTRAAAHFRDWREQGVLKQDAEPSIYAYSERFRAPGTGAELERRGFIALGKIEDYSSKVVFRHEQTLAKPKADRLDLLRATQAHFGQIFMLYEDNGDINSKLSAATRRTPEIEVTDEYGVVHRVWAISEQDLIQSVQAGMRDKRLIIADGHHRYETALSYRDERRAADVSASQASAPYELLIMTFVGMNSPELLIMPTHRVVHGIPGFSAEEFVSKSSQFFEVIEIDSAMDAGQAATILRDKGAAGTALLAVTRGRSVVLHQPKAAGEQFLSGLSPRQQALDVVQLHKCLLESVLSLSEESIRNQQNISYVRDAGEALGQVRTGQANVAFLMNPCRVEQVRDVAFAGEVMPQKSTDFYPKLLSGLTIYALD